MSFEIGKWFRFEAAHRLVHHDGKCSNYHGHSYEFELVVASDEVQLTGAAAGMVDDYAILSKVGKEIEELFDHKDLNEVLDSDTVTAEELSRCVHAIANKKLRNLVQVTFKETDKTRATYRPRIDNFRRVTLSESVYRDICERLYKGIDTSDVDSCWEFLGSVDEDGYGLCSAVVAGTRKAHRLSAWLVGEDIENKVVMHMCDNPRCVNPSHLLVGTHRDNEFDKDVKKRRLIGEDHGAAILQETEVIDILERLKSGESRRGIASSFGVSTVLINAIHQGRVWKNIPRK